ncbi:DUF4244 domain-containing protein [Arthrobacter sp. Soc17.1.1.1]|uniref:DUF4244 domain-containing protein n=1 Tax=Arthrobacter sp. Soc17.1.1.1 TaxID=3121277 RepID=UPI002FE4C69F
MGMRMQQHGTVEDPGQRGGDAFSKEVPVDVTQGGRSGGGTVCPVMPLSVASAVPGGRVQIRPALVGRTPFGQGQDGQAQIVPLSSVGMASMGAASIVSATGTGGTGTGGERSLPTGDRVTPIDPIDPIDPIGRGDRAARRAGARRRRSDDRVTRHRRDAVDREAGMATAEYAIATLAAVGFAALLVAVLSSGEVRGLLMSLITSALNFG